MGKVLVFAVSVALLAAVSARPAHAQWVSRTSGTTALLENVHFTGINDGWLVGDGGTTRFTTDAGLTWAPEVLTAGDVADITFRGAVGLAVADNGQIFRTTGASWSPVSSGTTENLMGVAFGGPGLAYASGRNGVILTSNDDGASWTVAETGTDRYRGAAAQGTNAWHTGDGGVIRATTDSGATWFDQNSGTANDLRKPHFISATEGWVSGSNSTVLYTSDGGASWTLRNTGITGGLNDISFVSPTMGWTVGDAGAVFATTNGGLVWFSEGSGTVQNLNGVFFLDANWGWAVGDAGALILRDGVTDVAPSSTGPQLLGSAPNPFRARTTIRFRVPDARGAGAVVTIHDSAGRLLRTLDATGYGEATLGAVWDGRDDSGVLAASGVYFFRVSGGSEHETGRVVLLR